MFDNIVRKNEWLSSASHISEQPLEAGEFHGRWRETTAARTDNVCNVGFIEAVSVS